MNLPSWLHQCQMPEPCPEIPELPPLADGLQERLEYFVSRGYRPRIKTHAFGFARDSAIWNEMVEAGWVVMADGRLMGWVIDAFPLHGQGIVGATKRTINEALVYSETELIKLRGVR